VPGALVSRVLLLYQPTDGGVARHIRDLAGGLGARGYEVILCGPSPLGGASAGARHRRVEMQRSIDPRADLAAVRAVSAIVRELCPDVVHAHSSKAGAIARLARVAHPRLPLVYSPHLYAFAGHFQQPGERRLYRQLERLLAPLASRVLCVCEDEARLARSIGPAGRVRVVYNGVPPAGNPEIDPRPSEMSAAGALVGALTLLHRRKGLETLIDATPAILARHPRAQLAVFGDGPELDALRDRARACRVEGAVRFLGACSDPLAALAGVDVFAHPSWAESFPYVILEAMSMGCPIVATAVGGVPEAITDGDSGMLVPPHDPAALADAICALLDDPERRAKLGERARARVAERFSLASMVEGVSDVYEELIDARRSRSRRAETITP
jgi:glycosyltransferase involved in cell wall biosynthesis